MTQFFESKEYQRMKKQYEKEIFKLLGEYALFDPTASPPIKYISANKCAEYFKNKTVTISYTIEKQSKKGTKFETFENSKTYYDIWPTDPDMKEYKGVTFNCDETKVPKNIFNLFSGFRHFEEYKAKKVNLSVIHDHIRSLVNYVEEDYIYLMSWLAHIVQKPYELPQVIMVIISEEGTGKDIFAEFISKVIGEQYYVNTDKLETICGKFNSTLGGKLLLVCNETDPIESRQRTESIKFISTAKSVPIEAKGKDPVKTNLYGRLIMFSNRLLAFPIESGSRRPKIMQSSTKYLKATMGDAENAKYFTKLATQYYENKNYQKAFLDYLMDYDISEWKSSVIT